MIGKIDAVLPLTVQDVDRAWILLRSLERFGDALGRLWIVAPKKELEVIRNKCTCGLDIEFLADDELVPLWVTAQKISRVCPPVSKLIYGRGLRGWYVQQLIKFAIADRVETPFFLTLDADMFLTRPFRHDDLVRSGKGVWQRGKTTGLVRWNEWAAKVLNQPQSPWVSGVTPALLNREAVHDLRKFVSTKRVSVFERAIARMVGVDRELYWQFFLMRHLPWTEFSLYLTYLEARNTFDQYHWHSGDVGLYDNDFSVWTNEDWEKWNPDSVFSEANKGWFVIVQSFLKPSVTEVWDRVSKYFLR